MLYYHKEEKANWKGQALNFQSPPSDMQPPARLHLLNLPNSATYWQPGVQIPETVGDILIQSTTQALKKAYVLPGFHAWLW